MAAEDGGGYTKSVHVRHLQCDIIVGTSVMLREGYTVGRIIGFEMTEKSLTVEANMELYEKVADAGYADPALRYVTTFKRSSNHKVVSIEDIASVVFVFNMKSDVLKEASVQGMENVFLTTDPEDKYSLCSELSSADGQFSYVERMWQGLVYLQDILRRMLSKAGAKQKLRQSERVHISNEVWRFFVQRVTEMDDELLWQTTETRRVFQKVSNGGRCSTERTKKKSFFLRFETYEQLSYLSNLLGECCLFGIRKPKPRLNEGREIGELDTINVVIGQPTPSPIFKKSTKSTGVDFEYCGAYVRITVRYRKYTLKVDRTTGDVLKCPSAHLRTNLKRVDTRIATTANEHSTKTLVGFNFRLNACLYKVTKDLLIGPIEAICLKAPFHRKGDEQKVLSFPDRAEVEAEVDNYLL